MAWWALPVLGSLGLLLLLFVVVIVVVHGGLEVGFDHQVLL